MARFKYTVNGNSSYNLQLTTQELLLLAGDVEINPENLKDIKTARQRSKDWPVDNKSFDGCKI